MSDGIIKGFMNLFLEHPSVACAMVTCIVGLGVTSIIDFIKTRRGMHALRDGSTTHIDTVRIEQRLARTPKVTQG